MRMKKYRLLKHKYQQAKRALIDAVVMRGYRKHFSQSLILEPTNRCSLKCSCCPNGVAEGQCRQRGVMSRQTFDLVMAHLDVPVKKCFLHLCGEPFLNPDLDYFADQLLKRGISPVIFSNGYNIDLGLLDRILQLRGFNISFSMDMLSKEHYEEIRVPGHYEHALKSLAAINETFARHKRFYGLNIIVPVMGCDDMHEVMRSLFEQYSNLNTISLSSRWPWPKLPSTGDLEGHLSAKPYICRRFRDLPVVLWNGDVSFCNFDYTGEMKVGNITQQSMKEIVNGSTARRIRRHLLMCQYERESLCRECLWPRYDNFSLALRRRQFLAMNDDEQRELFERYYLNV